VLPIHFAEEADLHLALAQLRVEGPSLGPSQLQARFAAVMLGLEALDMEPKRKREAFCSAILLQLQLTSAVGQQLGLGIDVIVEQLAQDPITRAA
jgi:hypothetical protein